MMLLICFDLPRKTKRARQQANKFQKRLVHLGFTMKQYSLYEREVKKQSTIDYILAIIRKELPDYGEITLYILPNEVNNKQVKILGKSKVQKTSNQAKLIVI